MFASKLEKMSRYESLIEKHLTAYRGRGFRLLDERVYCDFCEYSIKIDKTHIKTQLSSHLKSQKHQKNEALKGPAYGGAGGAGGGCAFELLGGLFDGGGRAGGGGGVQGLRLHSRQELADSTGTRSSPYGNGDHSAEGSFARKSPLAMVAGLVSLSSSLASAPMADEIVRISCDVSPHFEDSYPSAFGESFGGGGDLNEGGTGGGMHGLVSGLVNGLVNGAVNGEADESGARRTVGRRLDQRDKLQLVGSGAVCNGRCTIEWKYWPELRSLEIRF